MRHAVLRSRDLLGADAIGRALSCLSSAFDRVETDPEPFGELVEFAGDALPAPDTFHECLEDFSLTATLPPNAEPRQEFHRILSHRDPAFEESGCWSVELTRDRARTGLDAVGLEIRKGQRNFKFSAHSFATPEDHASAYEALINAARLPLRLKRDANFAFEHTEGLQLTTNFSSADRPPGYVACSLPPESIEDSIARLLDAAAVIKTFDLTSTWHAWSSAESVQSTETLYRALVGALFPARSYRGTFTILPNLPHGLDALRHVRPAGREPSGQLLATAWLRHNAVSIVVRSSPGGHRLFVVGTHSLDGQELGAELGVPLEAATPT